MKINWNFKIKNNLFYWFNVLYIARKYVLTKDIIVIDKYSNEYINIYNTNNVFTDEKRKI